MKTVYDRDVDLTDACLVRAPFRVRSELRSSPQPGQPFTAPVACTSDSIALGDFAGSYAVCQPVKGAQA